MALEGLGDKLQAVLGKLKGKGKLSEKDVKAAMREVKLALLEADVNFLVVKKFIKKINERAVGQEILESLTPGQQVIKVVNEELTELMGGQQSEVNLSSKDPTIILMAGLQGSGKTTTSGKLGGYFKKQGKNPILAACDVYRPAAIKQLQVVGNKLEIPVYEKGQGNPVDIAKDALEHARKNGYDILIIDTAGRLHIDTDMMDEITSIKEVVEPHEILLVVDSMTGQDAVNVAKSFNEKLDINGVVLTKLDGDTRGGAALSVKAVTGKPIKFVGLGEKLEDIEPFHPDRMASRILGMGDVLSLIEKAQSAVDEKKAMELEKKLLEQQFTFEDFLDQLQQLKKMGPISDIIGMMPGMNSKKLAGLNIDDKQLVKSEAIIQSMTKKERANPQIINASRRKRIARGSGTTIQDVNRLLKSYNEFKKMMKQMNKKGFKKGKMKLPFM